MQHYRFTGKYKPDDIPAVLNEHTKEFQYNIWINQGYLPKEVRADIIKEWIDEMNHPYSVLALWSGILIALAGAVMGYSGFFPDEVTGLGRFMTVLGIVFFFLSGTFGLYLFWVPWGFITYGFFKENYAMGPLLGEDSLMSAVPSLFMLLWCFYLILVYRQFFRTMTGRDKAHLWQIAYDKLNDMVERDVAAIKRDSRPLENG